MFDRALLLVLNYINVQFSIKHNEWKPELNLVLDIFAPLRTLLLSFDVLLADFSAMFYHKNIIHSFMYL